MGQEVKAKDLPSSLPSYFFLDLLTLPGNLLSGRLEQASPVLAWPELAIVNRPWMIIEALLS